MSLINKEFKQKWIEALRSEKYGQGRGFINVNNERFCCLGVACERHKKFNNYFLDKEKKT